MNLASAFGNSCLARSPSAAIYWGDAEITFGQAYRQARQVGERLQRQFKVKPRDRVGIWLKNCPEFVSALFGSWLAQAVVVPINNFLRPREVAFILEDAGIDVLITEAALQESLNELQAARPSPQFVTIEQFASWPDPDVPAVPMPQQEQDLALIIYTSGTTGHPKGAMLTHGNLLHNVESCRKVLHAVSFDRFVILLPMFHSFMLTVGVILPVLIGGSMVLIKSLQSPKNIIQEAMDRQATILPAIPQFFRALANATLPPSISLRICISGAAPLPGEVLREFNAHFPIPLLEGYGLSEASPVVSMNPIAGPWKAGSIGVPVPGVEVSVQDDNGRHLAAGEVGEICVRGGNVMQGYWNQPEETKKALRNGWLLTGDIGYGDSDGYFFITDRKKDMLLVNGINVYPREIEEVIYQFSDVKEAAVIGIPDARKGEQPLAFVAPKDSARIDERALIQFIKDRLADYKVPRRIMVMPNLPRNATGKILKTVLRAQANAAPESEA
jgi:long-chain acyl-CoA synthetase